MKKRSMITMALAFALVAIMAVGGTMAWLSGKTKTLTKTYTTGKVEISINDNFFVDKKTPIVPGDTITNPLFIKNDGTVPAKAMVIIDLNTANLDVKEIDNFLTGSKVKNITYEIQKADAKGKYHVPAGHTWIVCSYDGSLAVGPQVGEQVNFLDEVKLSQLYDESVMDIIAKLQIKVIGYGVQAEHFNNMTWKQSFKDLYN